MASPGRDRDWDHRWPTKPQPAPGAPGAPAGRDRPPSCGFPLAPQPGRSTGALEGSARAPERPRRRSKAPPAARSALPAAPPGSGRRGTALTVPSRARQPSSPLCSFPLARVQPPSARLVPSRPHPRFLLPFPLEPRAGAAGVAALAPAGPCPGSRLRRSPGPTGPWRTEGKGPKDVDVQALLTHFAVTAIGNSAAFAKSSLRCN